MEVSIRLPERDETLIGPTFTITIPIWFHRVFVSGVQFFLIIYMYKYSIYNVYYLYIGHNNWVRALKRGQQLSTKPIFHLSSKYFNCVSDERQRNGMNVDDGVFCSFADSVTDHKRMMKARFLTITLDCILVWIRTVFNLFITGQSIFDASHTSAISKWCFWAYYDAQWLVT